MYAERGSLSGGTMSPPRENKAHPESVVAIRRQQTKKTAKAEGAIFADALRSREVCCVMRIFYTIVLGLGREKQKLEPRPGALLSQSAPPWASTMPRAMESPSPRPSTLPRTEGSR